MIGGLDLIIILYGLVSIHDNIQPAMCDVIIDLGFPWLCIDEVVCTTTKVEKLIIPINNLAIDLIFIQFYVHVTYKITSTQGYRI